MAVKRAAKKKPPVPPEEIVAVAIEADETIRDEAADLVRHAIAHQKNTLLNGAPDRKDRIAQTYTQLVVKQMLERGPQGNSMVEEFHELRRQSGLARLRDDGNDDN